MVTVVTWNCSQAFRRKKDHVLQAYNPDILVIQECENPAVYGDWGEFSDWVWDGNDDTRGIGIFARNGIELTEEHGNNRASIAAETSSPVDVIGVWTKNDATNPANRYISQAYTALKKYDDWLDEDTLVVGDFNWNATFPQSPHLEPLQHDFTETIQLLQAHNLTSAYHATTGCGFGEEHDPTYYARNRSWNGRNEETGALYHTDYVFLNTDLVPAITDVQLGTKQDWVYNWDGCSDHVPVRVTLECHDSQ
ncbi:Endonuclease/Exonuclease/phosphatase family protein [Halovenus aranensis]|uniref:Endonuclease/Exonuclease/phosphatase family protein n=1 Tax=Halovenus aranensis TaxID=890420 RepID=A0A1G8ZU45_9EURY|nr:endonuclease/exonuclease/phosphatase family protein [Halovenus aranensis]SDK18649.1 Endonuclease/Exonuclease/phosphatase family protein [Halovenus aranensis]